MKKVLIAALLVITVLAGTGYMLYRAYMPEIIAEMVVSDSLPGFVPKRFKAKVEAIKKPINKGTEAMLVKMHQSDISFKQLLEAIDKVTEKELFAFLEEVEETAPSTLNEIFDLAKMHFQTDIDIEVFREPFVRNFELEQVLNSLAYANMSRKRNDIDMATAKAIVKMILIEKETEINKKLQP